jgi:tetratricopeptide (TPR) repeat protein
LAAAESALDLAEQCGAAEVVNLTLQVLGTVAAAEGDFERAHGFLKRGLALSRAARDRDGIETALVDLGDISLVAGDYERAIELTTEVIENEAHEDAELVARLGQCCAMTLSGSSCPSCTPTSSASRSPRPVPVLPWFDRASGCRRMPAAPS